ncbi:hypothetical protein AKJ09_04480 [Labilithrix luteola]|uniref:Uncharacterized protein n=1 Tax=Labilithrix luteola TaxID=1391654 RepID=A0A0K1PWR6_9BACT|nr:hypothetical protein [Labilithrix luteola]AKU97816.1 hypothetical protein AKJ09_04480 [Labilithrix luteola]
MHGGYGEVSVETGGASEASAFIRASDASDRLQFFVGREDRHEGIDEWFAQAALAEGPCGCALGRVSSRTG